MSKQYRFVWDEITFDHLAHAQAGLPLEPPCGDFASDTFGDDPNVCTTCLYHADDHVSACAVCGDIVHSDYKGTLIDSTGGDVCSVVGDDALHSIAAPQGLARKIV